MTKDTDINGTVRRPTATDVQRGISEARRLKSEASEYQGMHGQHVKTWTEKWGVHRKAFGWCRALADMEEDKRAACLRDFLDLSEKMGFTAQREMFAAEGEQLDEKVEAAKGAPKASGKRAKKNPEFDETVKAAELRSAETQERLAREQADGEKILSSIGRSDPFEDDVTESIGGVH